MFQSFKHFVLIAVNHIKQSVQKNYLKDLFNAEDFVKEFIIKVIECLTAFLKFFSN